MQFEITQFSDTASYNRVVSHCSSEIFSKFGASLFLFAVILSCATRLGPAQRIRLSMVIPHPKQ